MFIDPHFVSVADAETALSQRVDSLRSLVGRLASVAKMVTTTAAGESIDQTAAKAVEDIEQLAEDCLARIRAKAIDHNTN